MTDARVLTRVNRTQRFPFPVTVFQTHRVQPYIYGCIVTITGVDQSFLVYFNKHKRLQYNEALSVPLRGELLVMKLGKRGSPIGLRSRKDKDLAKWLSIRYVVVSYDECRLTLLEDLLDDW